MMPAGLITAFPVSVTKIPIFTEVADRRFKPALVPQPAQARSVGHITLSCSANSTRNFCSLTRCWPSLNPREPCLYWCNADLKGGLIWRRHMGKFGIGLNTHPAIFDADLKGAIKITIHASNFAQPNR